MKAEALLNERTALPPEGQRQVIAYIAFIFEQSGYSRDLRDLADYIDFIRQKYSASNLSASTICDFSSEDFVGIWKDRNEIENSTEWVRKLRTSEWIN